MKEVKLIWLHYSVISDFNAVNKGNTCWLELRIKFTQGDSKWQSLGCQGSVGVLPFVGNGSLRRKTI